MYTITSTHTRKHAHTHTQRESFGDTNTKPYTYLQTQKCRYMYIWCICISTTECIYMNIFIYTYILYIIYIIPAKIIVVSGVLPHVLVSDFVYFTNSIKTIVSIRQFTKNMFEHWSIRLVFAADSLACDMGKTQWVDSLKYHVSFAKEPYQNWAFRKKANLGMFFCVCWQ